MLEGKEVVLSANRRCSVRVHLALCRMFFGFGNLYLTNYGGEGMAVRRNMLCLSAVMEG